MSHIYVSARGIGSWRERLAAPDRQWRRGYSALETAVSWEHAFGRPSELPEPIEELLMGHESYGQPRLLFAVAEHKVPLAGRGGDSQCDVWAVITTYAGCLSLAVEAKAREPFGNRNQPLGAWLQAGNDNANRQMRWNYINQHLPEGDYAPVPYQLVHRCAAAVIEARRLGLMRAAFIVQAFNAPEASFDMFALLCAAMGIEAVLAHVGNMPLGVGWADCPLATDRQVADVI